MSAPVAYPLGPPTYSGNTLTVDTALNEPTRVTRRIADLTLQRFIVSQIFATGGPVSGGAVVYDQALLNELYLERDVERVMPGDEFPIVTSVRQAPKVAEVEKWGGKFFVTDEARDRNDVTSFNNQVTQLANTIVRKVNTRAVETLEAAIAALGGAGTFVGNNWNAVVTTGTSATSAAGWPAADFAKAQMLADVDELGVTYDLWLVNPAQKAQLAIIYGSALADVLAANGIVMEASNRIAAGTAYVVERGQVGEIRVEKALGTESWREQSTERTWVQSSVRPVMYVTNPYSIRKVTGLAG
jgi:hypothetical protein